MYNLLRLAVLVISVKGAAAGPLGFDTRSVRFWKHERSVDPQAAVEGSAEVNAEDSVSTAIVFTNLKGAPIATKPATTISEFSSDTLSSISSLSKTILSPPSQITSNLYTSSQSTPSPSSSTSSAPSRPTGGIPAVKPHASLQGLNATTSAISPDSNSGFPSKESTSSAFASATEDSTTSSTLSPTTLTVTISGTGPYSTSVSAIGGGGSSNSGNQSTQASLNATTSLSRLFSLLDGASTTVSSTSLTTGFVLSTTGSIVSSSRALGIFPTAASSTIAGFGTAAEPATTSKISMIIPGTGPTLSPTPTTQSNLAMALELNSLFKTLKANSTCNPNHTIESTTCIEGRVALCGSSGKYLFIECAPGMQCFALPRETGQGVEISCDTPADAALRLGQSLDNGSITGNGTSSATAATLVSPSTSSETLLSATAGTSISTAAGALTTTTASSDSLSSTVSSNSRVLPTSSSSSISERSSPSALSPFTQKEPPDTAQTPTPTSSVLPVQTAPGGGEIASITTITSTVYVTKTIQPSSRHKKHSTTSSTSTTSSGPSGGVPTINNMSNAMMFTVKVTVTNMTTATATVTQTVTNTINAGGTHQN